MNKSPIDQFNESVPLPLLIVLRGIGQVFFQENAVSGLLFLVGIALSAPLMAIGALVGSAIGSGVAWVMKWDRGELEGGIFGFNATLVGIASFFFFQPGLVTIGLMIAGCVVATLLTRFMRVSLPFPTYTTPFIVTTWVLFYLGNSMGAVVNPGGAPLVPNIATGYYVESTVHGIGQVMFQSSLWTGLFFLVGLAISDSKHATLVFIGSIVGLLVSKYHFTFGGDAVDPERLVERSGYDLIQLGLYGYNATLAPVALYLAKRSWIPAILGMFLTVPLTDLVPLFGLPALTAPFVIATWLVLAVSYVETKFKSSLPDR
jgi:urea transporter